MRSALHIGTLGKPHGIKGAISIYSKTFPDTLILEEPLYLEDGRLFEVSKYESHHKKLICFSPLIPDRTEAEKWTQTPLYCKQDLFFQKNPDQVFDDLCQGYTVFDKKNNNIGILEAVTFMTDIPMLIVKDNTQTLHLGLKTKKIDHKNKTIHLEYICHDH